MSKNKTTKSEPITPREVAKNPDGKGIKFTKIPIVPNMDIADIKLKSGIFFIWSLSLKFKVVVFYHTKI